LGRDESISALYSPSTSHLACHLGSIVAGLYFSVIIYSSQDYFYMEGWYPLREVEAGEKVLHASITLFPDFKSLHLEPPFYYDRGRMIGDGET